MEHVDTTELLAHADELYTSGRLIESLGAYEAVVAHDPTSATAYSRIGAIYAQTGEPERAAQALNKALELDPALAAAHSNLGNLYYSRGQYAQAQTQYKRALELEPTNPLFHENLHAAYKKQGMYAEAVAALKQARRLVREEARTEANGRNIERKRPGMGRGGCFTMVVLITFILVFASLYLAQLSV